MGYRIRVQITNYIEEDWANAGVLLRGIGLLTFLAHPSIKYFIYTCAFCFPCGASLLFGV